MEHNWKLPSERVYKGVLEAGEKEVKNTTGLGRVRSLASTERYKQAESDLIECLNMLERKALWMKGVIDQMGAEWFLAPRFEEEHKEIESLLTKYRK